MTISNCEQMFKSGSFFHRYFFSWHFVIAAIICKAIPIPPASLILVIKNEKPLAEEQKSVQENKKLPHQKFFRKRKIIYLITFVNGCQRCLLVLIHFVQSFILVYLQKSLLRNYWLMTITDSRLCILSSKSKAQNTKSSQSVDAQSYWYAPDNHLLYIWLECRSTWLPEMQGNSEKFHNHCKLKQFFYNIFWWIVGRQGLKIINGVPPPLRKV